MVTVRRHPVPPDSYQPDRPLNDLICAQLEHFKQVAARLPADQQAALPPVPSSDDAAASNRFIAAVTDYLMDAKRKPIRIVPRRPRKPLEGVVEIAAQVEGGPPAPAPKRRSRSKKSKSGSPRA